MTTTTALPYQYHRLDDIDAWQMDAIYSDLSADHAELSDTALRARIDRYRLMAADALTYGVRRADTAKRLGEHAECEMSLRKIRNARTAA